MAKALAVPFRYAFATNATTTSFTAQNATATEPSGVGVFDLASPNLSVGTTVVAPSERVATYLQLVPFLVGADNDTFGLKIYGFTPTVPADLVTDTALYIPQLLAHLTITAGARTFSDHTAACFLADTIVVTKGPADNAEWLSVISPADDSVASVILNTRGCRYIKFDVDLLVTPTAVNCLWRPVDF